MSEAQPETVTIERVAALVSEIVGDWSMELEDWTYAIAKVVVWQVLQPALAEARAALLAELRAAVEGLPRTGLMGAGTGANPDRVVFPAGWEPMVSLPAVLALLEPSR